MTHNTEDMGLSTLCVDGVFHGFAIHGQGAVSGQSPGLHPAVERPIERTGFHPHQAIADHKFTGNDITFILAPAAETLPGGLPEALGPVRHGHMYWGCVDTVQAVSCFVTSRGTMG